MKNKKLILGIFLLSIFVSALNFTGCNSHNDKNTSNEIK